MITSPIIKTLEDDATKEKQYCSQLIPSDDYKYDPDDDVLHLYSDEYEFNEFWDKMKQTCWYKEAKTAYSEVLKDIEEYNKVKTEIEAKYMNGDIEYPEAERSIEREAIGKLFKYRRSELLIAPEIIYEGERSFYNERQENLKRIRKEKYEKGITE